MNFKALYFFWALYRKPITKLLLIMKFSAILLFVACLQASAIGHAQTVTLSMKDAPLQKVFKEINHQTGLQFFYKDKLLNQAGKVDIEVTDMPVQDALKLCFQNLPITYELVNNTIVVKEKQIVSGNAREMPILPPPIDIAGTVTNEKGEPIAGASVTVKGTKKGTTTNEVGFFMLNEVDNNATLIISGANIETTERKLAGKNTLNIVVKIKMSLVDEVQVIGYGTTSKRFNTGNVATVKGEEIKDRPVGDITQAL